MFSAMPFGAFVRERNNAWRLFVAKSENALSFGQRAGEESGINPSMSENSKTGGLSSKNFRSQFEITVSSVHYGNELYVPVRKAKKKGLSFNNRQPARKNTRTLRTHFLTNSESEESFLASRS